MQILIVDKQLLACRRETTIFEEDHIITSRFEVSPGKFVSFLPIYGVPHCPGNRSGVSQSSENATETMTQDLGLECTIYHHWDAMEKHIISRHGSKGGRIIHGMYTSPHDQLHVQGIAIVKDMGIHSDYDMVVSKIDLGIQRFDISKEKEEQIDFRHIMNILVALKPGHDHPTLNENVYEGREFKLQKELYLCLQEVTLDPQLPFINQVTTIQTQLEILEQEIIAKFKASNTPE